MVQPILETKASDLAILTITVIIFAVFVMGLASVCYRWSVHRIDLVESVNRFTNSDAESTSTRNTVGHGLDVATVKSFPTFLYSEVKEKRIGKGGVECAVCLCEFEDDEMLCLMPKCCHVFHTDCVSVWLSDHSTCPLCRVDLILRPGESILDPDPDSARSTDEHLLDRVTWTNRNSQSRSMSTRLSHCRVSKNLFSRSHSTGHSVVQPVNDIDRFMLRLPEDVQLQLTKNMVMRSDAVTEAEVGDCIQ